MKIKVILPALVLALTSCSQSQPLMDKVATEATARVHFETITRVIDGDTVAIDARWAPYPNLIWHVRMTGIDTPEKGSLSHCARERELAASAKATTEQLVHETLNRVRLRNVRHDKYGGRLLADIIMADGRNMSEELIRVGAARPYNGKGPKPNWCA